MPDNVLIPQPCPYPNCTGEVTYPEETCCACGDEIAWKKDPDHGGGRKPIRPGTSG
jgi:hypothetical protein